MSKETVSFRIDVKKRAALDALASALDRDRSHLINDALDAFLDLHRWQVEHIERTLAETDAGAPGVPHDEVFRRLRARIEERVRTDEQ